MNTCLSQLFNDTLLPSKALSNDSLLSEHALVACLLHANIGLEVGSFLLEALLVQFTEHLRDDVETKILDNLLIFISYLYAFHMTNSKLIFDLGRELLNVDELNEKRLEVILLLLKTIGFLLRKDNPLELKAFLQQVRSASASLSPSSKRVQFMMETITSLKNNDIRKLPGAYEPERIDRLRKVYKSLVKDKNVQQANLLNVGLEDFRLAKERGRWWIVGSAWQKPIEPKKSAPTLLEEQVDDKIRLLAKQQHMNTDIRRSIFATLLTSQVCQIDDRHSSFILSSSRIVMRPWRNFINSIWVKSKNEKSFMSLCIVPCMRRPTIRITRWFCNALPSTIVDFKWGEEELIDYSIYWETLDFSSISHVGSIQRSFVTHRWTIGELRINAFSTALVQFDLVDDLQGKEWHRESGKEKNDCRTSISSNWLRRHVHFSFNYLFNCLRRATNVPCRVYFNSPPKRTSNSFEKLSGKLQRKRISPLDISESRFRLFLSHFILKKKQFSELIHRRCQLVLAQLTEE